MLRTRDARDVKRGARVETESILSLEQGILKQVQGDKLRENSISSQLIDQITN